ncbi:MAG: ribonuclease E/G [Rhodospirillales bacterium]
MLPTIDRVILEAAPGEARAVAFSGNEAWDIAIERPSDGPSEGDIYRARAGAPGPDGGRFFDLGDGRVGLARRVKPDWTEGAYGLVQILRGDAGEKGARVTDRVWLNQGGLSVSIGADGNKSDRVEISRSLPRAIRDEFRERLEKNLPKGVAVRVLQALPGDVEAEVRAMSKFLNNLANTGGNPRQLHQAPGEIEQLAARTRGATWIAADLVTNVWAASYGVTFAAPDQNVYAEIDSTISSALERMVALIGGGTIWIDPTRALTAIDVDSGSADIDSVNLIAAREIARQVRLRRLGGIIAIDFIRKNINPALALLDELSRIDPWAWRAPHEVDAVGLASFQRERRGQSLSNIATGVHACALKSLKFASRNARNGAAVIEASGIIVDLLQGPLKPGLLEAERRVGRSLELKRSHNSDLVVIRDSGGKLLHEE